MTSCPISLSMHASLQSRKEAKVSWSNPNEGPEGLTFLRRAWCRLLLIRLFHTSGEQAQFVWCFLGNFSWWWMVRLVVVVVVGARPHDLLFPHPIWKTNLYLRLHWDSWLIDLRRNFTKENGTREISSTIKRTHGSIHRPKLSPQDALKNEGWRELDQPSNPS